MFILGFLIIGLLSKIPFNTEAADANCNKESNACSADSKCCDGLFCQPRDFCQKCLPDNDRCWSADYPGQCCDGGSCTEDEEYSVLRCTGGAAPAPDNSGILQNVKTKTCLHIKNEDNSTNGALNLVKCDLSDQNQLLDVNDWENYADKPGYVHFTRNGFCVEAKDGGTDNLVPVVQDKCVKDNAQIWRIHNGKYSDTFQLQNVASGRCLELKSADSAANIIDQYDCMALSKSPHHYWRIIKKGMENLIETNIADCEKKECTDENVDTACTCGVTGSANLIRFCDNGHCSYCGKYKNYCSFGKTTEDGEVECCDKIGRKVDDKGITPDVECRRPGGGKGTLRSRCYQDNSGILENVKLKTCLHIKNEDNGTNGPLNLVKCDVSDQNQRLNVDDWENYADTPGYIHFTRNGFCVEAKDGGSDNLVPVVQDKCVKDNAQKWRIHNGKYTDTFQLQNVKSGRCIEPKGGDGQIIDQYDCMALSSSPHHYWRIVKESTNN